MLDADRHEAMVVEPCQTKSGHRTPGGADAPSGEILDLVLRGPSSGRDRPSAYQVFGALNWVLGDLHDTPWLGVFTPSYGRGCYSMRIRLHRNVLPAFLEIRGLPVNIGRTKVIFEEAREIRLVPAPDLLSECVCIAPGGVDGTELDGNRRYFRDEEAFRLALRRQLEQLKISADIILGPKRSVPVAGATAPGWAVLLRGLSDLDSLLVQERGFGGRRRCGAGLFLAFDWRW